MRVLTFKEGLLSRVAHDLELSVTRFDLELEEDASKVRGTFDTGSVRVVTPLEGGRPIPGALSAKDVATIEANIREDVLHSARFPRAEFESTRITENSIEGRFTLHGVSRSVCGDLVSTSSGRTATFELDQREFGITPYRAMMGTLRLKSHVTVEVTIPYDIRFTGGRKP